MALKFFSKDFQKTSCISLTKMEYPKSTLKGNSMYYNSSIFELTVSIQMKNGIQKTSYISISQNI